MARANEGVDLTNSKGEMVASIDGEDDGTIEVTFWDPPKSGTGSQGGNDHIKISRDSLTLYSRTRKSKIVFSFSDEEAPIIQAIRNDKVIWSSSGDED